MSIEQLKSQIRQLKTQVSAYERHSEKVQSIIRNIDNSFDDDIYQINSEISLCMALLSSGLAGCNSLATVTNNLDTSKEKSSESDLNISECRSNLSNEINRCQSKIVALENEIRELESQIEAQRDNVFFGVIL